MPDMFGLPTEAEVQAIIARTDAEEAAEEQERLTQEEHERLAAEEEATKPKLKPAIDVGAFDPTRVITEAAAEKAMREVEELEAKLREVANTPEASDVLDKLTKAAYEADNASIAATWGNLDDNELVLMNEDLQMKKERAQVDADRLLAEGFSEDSLTYQRAVAARDEIGGEQRRVAQEQNRRLDTRAVEETYANQAFDRALEKFRAEQQAKLDELKANPDTEPWEILRQEAELRVPFTTQPDMRERVDAELAGVRSEGAQRRFQNYREQVEARFSALTAIPLTREQLIREELGMPAGEPLSAEAQQVLEEADQGSDEYKRAYREAVATLPEIGPAS